MLVASMGGGEWLVGPAIGVQYGMGLFWVATLAIILQVIFNLESIRYTLYTGEPILSGIMRLSPGPKFWAPFWVLLGGAQLGLPALAAGCAAVLFAAFAGHMPQDADAAALSYVSYGVMGLTAVILLLGKTIERTLEYVSWAMIVVIFGFLLFVNVFFVPASNLGHVVRRILPGRLHSRRDRRGPARCAGSHGRLGRNGQPLHFKLGARQGFRHGRKSRRDRREPSDSRKSSFLASAKSFPFRRTVYGAGRFGQSTSARIRFGCGVSALLSACSST